MTEKARRIRAPHLVGVPRMSDEALAAFWADSEPDRKARQKIAIELARCKRDVTAARLSHYCDGDE